MLYHTFKKIVGIFFNMLNLFMFGNLPPFGCVCIIVEEQGRYLTLERPGGTIVFPGGFMQWREHPTQTAQREGMEETGLDLRIGDVITYYSRAANRIDRMSTITIVYRAEVVGGELRASIEGRPIWSDEQDIRARLHANYKELFEDYLRSKHSI